MLKKGFAIVMAAILMTGAGLSSYASAIESERMSVIDSDLRTKMSEASPGEKLSVEVTLPDIDSASLEDSVTFEEAVEMIESGEDCPPIYHLRRLLNSSNVDVNGDTMQELIMTQRRSYAELYEKWNGEFVKDNLNGLDVTYVGHYFPMVQLELTAAEINRLALCNGIESIMAIDTEPASIAEANSNSDSYSTLSDSMTISERYEWAKNQNKQYRDFMRITQVQNLGYSGSGIKIGVSEGGLPDSAYWDVLGLDSEHCKGDVLNSSTSIHPTNVVFEIKQTAPQAEIYCAGLSAEHFEWMLDNGVNIINCSHSKWICQAYTLNETKIIDALVHDYYVVVVAADANEKHTLIQNIEINDISGIAAAYNAIAVGNVDESGVIRSNSCYSLMSNNDMAYRPDLCAVGQMHYLYPYSDTQISGSGTSYSSPRVAGAIALLMQGNSDLMIAPELVKSIICVSTRTGTNQYCLCGSAERAGYEKYGAGTLDCYRAYLLASSDSYDYPIFTKTSFMENFSVNVLAGQTLRLSVASVKNNSCEYVDGRRPVYSVTEGTLPNISITISSADHVDNISLNESTTSLQIAELTATNSGTFGIMIRLATSADSDVFYSYSYVIQ